MIEAYSDGAARGNPGPSSCAFVIYDENGEMDSGARYLDKQTNNYAEYSGLLDLLHYLEKHKIVGAVIYCDSILVVNQVNGRWKIKHPEIRPLALQAMALKVKGQHIIKHIDGHSGILGNERADELCNEVLDAVEYGKGYSTQYQHFN